MPGDETTASEDAKKLSDLLLTMRPEDVEIISRWIDRLESQNKARADTNVPEVPELMLRGNDERSARFYRLCNGNYIAQTNRELLDWFGLMTRSGKQLITSGNALCDLAMHVTLRRWAEEPSHSERQEIARKFRDAAELWKQAVRGER